MSLKQLLAKAWTLVCKEPIGFMGLLIAIATFGWSFILNATSWASTDIRSLIRAEAEASLARDIDRAVSLYTEDGVVRDWGSYQQQGHQPRNTWSGAKQLRERYSSLPTFTRLAHVDVNIVEVQLLAGAARAGSSTDGIMILPGQTSQTLAASINGDIWEFRKVNRVPFMFWTGEWKISSFTHDAKPSQ